MASVTWGTAFRHLRSIFGAGSLAGLGDGALLARYSSSQDEVAFEALVNRHGPMVLSTCRAILRNEHDVEDAFQATFLILAKKAGSIRAGDGLAAWLHRVAYRASVQAGVEAARRRRKEAEAVAMALPNASRPGPETDHDWKPILHEEISRLPEGQRLPVVLCDLEGLTYEQAAGQLGWTVPTVRCRLAKARQRLRGRLTRRGVTALGGGALLAPPGTSAAMAPEIVPPALVRATITAVTGGSASSGATLLAHILLRGMLMTKVKTVSTAALAALVLGAGMLATAGGRPDDAVPTKKTQTSTPAAKEEPTRARPGETVEVRGIVATPDGQPVAGAVVRVAYNRDESAGPKTTSGPDGRFVMRLPKPGRPNVGYQAHFPWIIASAPGFGIGWVQGVLRADPPAEQVLKLPLEGPPIEGRVVDLEGHPVVGARVEVYNLWFAEKGKKDGLADWIARARNGAEGNLWQGLEHFTLRKILPVEAATGSDGRFRLNGVGRDRIADLLVSGPGIATTSVYVLSRDEPEIRMADRAFMRAIPLIVHTPKFQVALPPGKRVEGIARDKDSGSPIAGLKINVAVFDEQSFVPAQGIEATTDAKGHYRLDGLPKAAAYRLFLNPGKGLPYLTSMLKVPANSPALEPVAFDFTLKRGIFVRGKVTDKVTGGPAVGYANYYAFSDNPHLHAYEGYSRVYPKYGYIDEEGRYELVVLPGRGLITVRDEENSFLPVTGYERIKGYNPKLESFETVPYLSSPRSHAILVEIDLASDTGETIRDFQADPGRSVAVEVVGPDGSPVGGTMVKGMSEVFATAPFPQESARFEVHALVPNKPRRLVVMHEGRKLIGSVLLRGNETGSVSVKIEPWGTVSGRIVDDEGNPRKEMFIGSPGGSENKYVETHDILPWSDWNSGVRVGDDGRFQIEGLVPGLRYDAVSRSGFEAFGDLFKDMVVTSGEAKDLGDLKVQPPKTQEN